MALSQNIIQALQQKLNSDPSSLSLEQIVELINAEQPEAQQYVIEQGAGSANIPDSVYRRFDRDDIVPNRKQYVTQGAWSGGKAVLHSDDMWKSSCQLDDFSSKYFYEVWDRPDPDVGYEAEAARVQFYVSYGNKNGGGAAPNTTENPEVTEPTKATYAQYANILLPSPNITQYQGETDRDDIDVPTFNFGGEEAEDFYVINISRSRYKQTFDPGNWELRLKIGDFYTHEDLDADMRLGDESGQFEVSDDSERIDSSSESDYAQLGDFKPGTSGNYSVVSLVDETVSQDVDVSDYENERLEFGLLGRVLNVVSGSLNLEENYGPNRVPAGKNATIAGEQGVYGKFYPDAGIILLSTQALERHARVVQGEYPKYAFVETDADDNEINDWRLVYPPAGSTAENPDYKVIPPSENNPFIYYLTELANSGELDGWTRRSEDFDTVRDDVYDWIVSEEGTGGNENRAAGIIPNRSTKVYSEDGGEDKLNYPDTSFYNHARLYYAIKHGGYFVGRSVEEVISTHYFVRIRNREFNFSNNPTFASNETGELYHPEFFKDPKVFITTIGLYDDQNQLVAVGKLSKPVMKDFGREALVRIKLDY